MILSSTLPTIPPLFFITFIYIIGLAAEQTNTHIFIFPALLVFLIAAVHVLHTQMKASQLFMALILFISSYVLGALLLHQQKNNFREFHTYIDQKTLDMQGTIIDITSINHRLFKSVITLNSIATKAHSEPDSAWKMHNKKIQIYTNNVAELRVADFLELRAVKIHNPSSSSYQNYLIKENIGATLFVSQLDITQKTRPTYSLMRWLDAQKTYLYTCLKNKMSRRGFSIFSSLFLGKKENDTHKTLDKNKELFALWGISHYLARSGLHLVVLIALWLTIFNFLPLSFNKKQLCLIIISAVYLLLSWSSIPFYRALATFILYRICMLMRIQGHSLHLLIATCLFILLANPIQLFFLDFQLSFGLTFALACFSHMSGHQQKQQLNKPH